MRNVLKTIGLTLGSLFFAGTVFAGSISVQIEQPKSPTNRTDLKINFVVLDTSSSPSDLTAQCYKKGPTDGGFSSLGSGITISAGGNSAYCQTDGSFMTNNGTYQFYVNAGGVDSAIVSVDYNTSGPDTPVAFSKNDTGSCSYKITFKTANDGKTAKVELYRSPNTSFDINDGSKVDSQTIGPNTDGTFTNSKPDCGTTYYYAIRAFDAIGNGSGTIGDSEVHTVNTTVITGTTSTAGAIPAGTNGNVLGSSTGSSQGSTGPTGEVLGEANPTETPTISPTPTPTPKPTLFSGKTVGFGGGIIAVLIILFLLFK